MKRSMPEVCARRLPSMSAAAVLGGLLVANASVFAQQGDVITVTAPRTVHHKIVEHNMAGAEIEEVSLTRRVSYSGLDLGKQSDVAEIERRIDATAQDACRQLDKLYSHAEADRDCVSKAAGPAKAALKAIIAGNPR